MNFPQWRQFWRAGDSGSIGSQCSPASRPPHSPPSRGPSGPRPGETLCRGGKGRAGARTSPSWAVAAPGAIRGRAPKLDGAVTSLPAAMAVFALARRRFFGWYLMLALLVSMAVGFLYPFALSW